MPLRYQLHYRAVRVSYPDFYPSKSNFKMVIREDVGEPRLFTAEKLLSTEFLENFVLLMEGGYDILKAVVQASKISRQKIINFWRVAFDIEEALKLAQEAGDDLKVPSGFYAAQNLTIQEDSDKNLVECQMPRFMIVKVTVQESGFARVF
jgi:hypothetical protein